MEEGGGGGGNGASSSTLLSGGGRQRFEVELRPGETTIVSWKKLVKDANKAAKYNNDIQAPPVPAPPVPPPVDVNPALDSRIAPPAGETIESEANDAGPGSRFSAVIEKIERLYMGKNSSDEEDLNDVPDDDEYDTEDSFIDDAELDEYFQVDDLAIKHDGFFVNRGKLECTPVSNNDPHALPSQQPKKRRKESTKGYGGGDYGHGPNKHMKVNKKATATDRNSTSQSHGITSTIRNFEDLKHQAPILALETVVKKSSDTKVIGDPSLTRITNGEATVTSKNIDNQKTGILQSRKPNMKLKDGSPSVLAVQRSNDKSSHVQSKSQIGQVRNNLEELSQLVQPRDKNVTHEQSDIKAPEISRQTPKNQLMARKEGSTAKPKSTMLEKAIMDLEKIVAESRPPSMEVADNSSQTVKRRMPPEIKQKLAKVARLAHTIHGEISEELLNHLMSIVGHLIQIRSLKNNLNNAVNKGLSAKIENTIRLQQLKKQVNEMVKVRIPTMTCKHAGESDDIKEMVLQRKYTIDEGLEDVICDIYDVFVDGLDEDAGPPVRKLCTELAEMWPKGFVNNHKLRRAICRAKDRRKAELRLKEQKSLRRKRLRAAKAKPIKLASDSANNNSLTSIRSISNTLAAQIPNSSVNSPKQEKLDGIFNDHGSVSASQVLVKTKVKEPETELGEGQIRQEKSILAEEKESQKSNKQTVPALQPSITADPQPPPPTLNVS